MIPEAGILSHWNSSQYFQYAKTRQLLKTDPQANTQQHTPHTQGPAQGRLFEMIKLEKHTH